MGSDQAANLHMFSTGCPELDRTVLFRDHLRNNLDELRFIEKQKERLAAQHWNTIQDYADAKTDTVKAILHRAS